LKHSKLGRKILIFMLVITMTVSVALFAVAYNDMTQLRDDSNKMSKDLGTQSGEVVSDGIIKEMNSALMKVTVAKAENHDAEFRMIQDQIEQMCVVLESEYKFPVDGKGYVPPHPSDSEPGVLMGRSAVAQRVEIDDSIISEQKIISQMEPLVSDIYSDHDITMNVMIGTATGIFYRYSDYNTFDDQYDVTKRGWFTEAMANEGKPVWSQAYTDAYGKYVTTVSCAYKNEKGDFAGVIASDIKIQSLIDDVLLLDRIGNGYAFLLDSEGKYIAHPSYREADFDTDPLTTNNPAKKQIIKQMVAGGTGKASYEEKREVMYAFYAPIPTTGWSYGMVVPYSSLTGPVVEARAIIDEGTDTTTEQMNNTIHNMLVAFIVIFAIIVIILIIVSSLVSISITRPVTRMVEGTEEIGKGNLDTSIVVKGKDELAILGNSINKMASDLKTYINELTEVTAERQRIGAELNVATSIQEDMLPKIFPKYSQNEHYSLAASMHPAKEVGGDFYDFYMIDEDRFALVIADVSGKGVPAALFMVISKTIIKSCAQTGKSVSEILENVNNQLCESNGADMFVTVLLGIINIRTGHLEYANAGHESPIIKRVGQDFKINPAKHGFVLGGMEGMKYKQYEMDLREGDIIYTYTDGIPEAHNGQNEMFGMDRTLEALNKHKDATPDELIEIVRQEVMDFAGEAPQFDDMTMLCYQQLKVD